MACDDLLSVSAHSSPLARSRPKHHNLYSPTGDPPKPGTGTTFLTRGGLAAHPELLRPPGPVLDATLPSSHFCFVEWSSCFLCYICLPGEAESALQACNPRGIPRPTAHQRCQAPGATP